jgi:hypothetical protein
MMLMASLNYCFGIAAIIKMDMFLCIILLRKYAIIYGVITSCKTRRSPPLADALRALAGKPERMAGIGFVNSEINYIIRPLTIRRSSRKMICSKN